MDMLNMFSGGALRRLSIFALGVMPYILGLHHCADDVGGITAAPLRSRKKANPAAVS